MRVGIRELLRLPARPLSLNAIRFAALTW
jgi:hypothetical protein